MAEGRESINLEKDVKRASKVEKKKGHLIKNPIARFNLNLGESNPDWQPTLESGLSQAPDHAPSKELLEERESSFKIEDPETGQGFNVLILNWKALERGERPVVIFPAYNSKINESTTYYRQQELARQTGKPVIAMDYPHVGGSDKLTPEQKKALGTEEGYGPIAEAQLRALRRLGMEKADLVGQSMGGWTAATVAEKASKIGVEIRNLIVIDSPGVEDLSPTELTKREISEGKYLDLYRSRPYDPEMRRTGGQTQTVFKQKFDTARWALNTLRTDPSGVYKKAMAKGTLPATLQSALRLNEDLRVRVINGTLSRVSTKEANTKMVKALREEFPDRVSQNIFPGEPHLLMEPAKRFAAIVKQAIR